MVPRPMTLIRNPVRPRVLYCINLTSASPYANQLESCKFFVRMSLLEGRPGDLFTSFTELGHFFSVYFVSSESMITKFFESFDNLMILKQFMKPKNLPILADQTILADYLYSMNHLISVMIGLYWQV